MSQSIESQDVVARPRPDRLDERTSVAGQMDVVHKIYSQYVAADGKLLPDADPVEVIEAAGQLGRIYIKMSGKGAQPRDIEEVWSLMSHLYELALGIALNPSASPDPNQSVYSEQGIGLSDIVNGGNSSSQHVLVRRFERGLWTTGDMMQQIVELSLKDALHNVCGGASLYDAGGSIHVTAVAGPTGQLLPPKVRLGDDFTINGVRPTADVLTEIENLIGHGLIEVEAADWEKVGFGPGNADNATYTVKSGEVTRGPVSFSN